jgi:hypothetical protein
MIDSPHMGDDGVWEGLPSETTVGIAWAVLAIDNGMRILTFGMNHQAGGSVHVVRPDGTEVAMWSCEEWETEGEGESVMGAMLLAASDRKKLKRTWWWHEPGKTSWKSCEIPHPPEEAPKVGPRGGQCRCAACNYSRRKPERARRVTP